MRADVQRPAALPLPGQASAEVDDAGLGRVVGQVPVTAPAYAEEIVGPVAPVTPFGSF